MAGIARAAFPLCRHIETLPVAPAPRSTWHVLSETFALGQSALALKKLGKEDMRDFLRVILMNVADLLDEQLTDDRLKGLLAFDAVLGAHLGPRSPTSLLGLYYRLAGEIGGASGAQMVPKGGMGEIIAAIAGPALQGPTSFAVLHEAGFAGVEHLKVFDLFDFPHQTGTVTISRTGFTGDLGYELFVPAQLALSLWDRLMEAGQRRGIRAIGYTALNRARLEAGLIVANADFSTAEHALRADRVRMPDEIGLGFMVDLEKGHFNGRKAIAEARRKKTLRHILVGLEIEGNIPADHAIVYHRKTKEVGLVSAASWSPLAKRNIAIASLDRPFGDTVTDNLWVEIYAMRELKYEKLMKRAKIVPRPFIKLDRRTANPPRSSDHGRNRDRSPLRRQWNSGNWSIRRLARPGLAAPATPRRCISTSAASCLPKCSKSTGCAPASTTKIRWRSSATAASARIG